MSATCQTCRYAEPLIGDDAEPYMRCRRFPAQLFMESPGDGPDGVMQGWPSVEADDWCGEWVLSALWQPDGEEPS